MSQSLAPSPVTWTPSLALSIALLLEGSGDQLVDILRDNSLSRADYVALVQNKTFQWAVTQLREDIRLNGLGFKVKAKMQAEQMLETSWNLVHHPEVSPAVKADLIKATVRWAGYEPKDSGNGTGVSAAAGVQVTINIPKYGESSKGDAVIDVTPRKLAS